MALSRLPRNSPAISVGLGQISLAGYGIIAAKVLICCTSLMFASTAPAARPQKKLIAQPQVQLEARVVAPAKAPAKLLTKLIPNGSDRAGQRAAGLICLPNGNLHVRDFIANESALHEIVGEEIAAARPETAALVADGVTVSIKVVSITSKMCARAWGVFGQGDRVSMSGRATVAFDWAMSDDSSARGDISSVTVEVTRSQAVSTEEILRMAIAQLIQIIVQKNRMTQTKAN